MSNVTRVLSQIESGDPAAAEQLLPLVYDELRKLAAAKLARERPGQTLQATALVHDAYLRLMGSEHAQHWHSRGHFFAAAAESMRRILIERARHKGRQKRGGEMERLDLAEVEIPASEAPGDLVALDDALQQLEAEDPDAARLVKLHFFAGLSLSDVAKVIGISRTAAYKQWAYARAWLRCALSDKKLDPPE